jgi:hypothetical protein
MSLGKGLGVYYSLIVDVCFDGSLTAMKMDSYDVDMCVIFEVLHGAKRAKTVEIPRPSILFGNVSFKTLHSNRDSSVGIATGYKLGDGGVGVRVPVGSRIFSSPRRPDRLLGPPSLLSNGYLGFFPRG